MSSPDPATDPQSLGATIRSLAETDPDTPVLWHELTDGSVVAQTWRQLDDRSDRLATALADRGLGEGDRMALGVGNTPEFVLATFAAWKLGAVPVPVRWDLPDWELTRVLDVVEPAVHLSRDDRAWVSTAADGTGGRRGDDAVSPHLYGICSSGSTGTPKVILSETSGVFDERFATPMIDGWEPVARPQTILVLAPMYHANGYVTLLNLLGGDRLVVLERFDAGRCVDAVESHRVSTFTATPTMLQRIADLPGVDERDLSSIDWILQGAAPMPPSLMYRWVDLIGAERIMMAYGMTEGLGITALRGDEWIDHPGSVGRGYRGTEVRILDSEQVEIPAGETGEIYLRSAIYRGYRYLGGAPRLKGTADGFETGGDVGYVDDDGFLYLLDRRVDMIITGGANVFPAEVESALIDHPAIADVVVIGLADPEWGRRVHAIVEPIDRDEPPTPDDVIAHAKARLAAYKVPKTVEFVDSMPRSEATKINRRRLVDERER